jgi:O-antigen ligase
MNRDSTLRSWPLVATVATFALAAAGVALATWYRSPAPLFLPAAAIAVLVLGRRLLTNPAPVLALFLVVAVNLDYVKLGALRVTLDVVVSAMLLWALVVRCALEGRSLLRDRLAVAYAAFLGLALISLVLSVDVIESVRQWVRDLEYLVLFALIAGLPLTQRERRWLLGAIVFSSLLPCLIGFFGLAAGIPSLLGSPAPLGGGVTVSRISATLSHPGTFSLYLAIVGTATLSLLLDGRIFRRRTLAPVFAIQMAALFMTYARSGWLAFLVGAAALLWLRGHRKLVLIGGPLLLAAFLITVPGFRGRVVTLGSTSDGTNSMIWRLGLWRYALQIFPQRPVFGSGPGTFLEHVAYQTGYGPHQLWIGQLIETGIVGTLGYLVMLVVLGRRLHARRRVTARREDPNLDAALACYVGLMASTFASNPFGLPSVAVYFWAMVGLALADEGPPR